MDVEIQQYKAEFFKALAHPIRIRILELLRDGDKNVTELQMYTGVDSSVISQQLGLLRNKNIVIGSKEGTKVTYTVKDPLIFDLLDLAKRIINHSLNDTITLLQRLGQNQEGS